MWRHTLYVHAYILYFHTKLISPLSGRMSTTVKMVTAAGCCELSVSFARLCTLQISTHERAYTTAMVNESSVKAEICRDIRRYAGRRFNLRSQQGNCRGTSIVKKSEAQLPRTPNASINLAAPPGDGLGSKCNSLSLILRRSRRGTVWFYTSTSNKRAARPKLYTKSLTRDLKRMYSRLTLVRISINL